MPRSDTAPRPIVVIGSINVDFVTRTLRLPGPGEDGHDLIVE